MKKTILLILGLLFITSYAGAQIIDNFDTPHSLGIFKDAGWGTLTDSIYQTSDPSGKSAGAMAVAFDLKGFSDKNAIRPVTQQLVNPNGSHQLTYWVFIPQNSGIPDSLVFGLWWQINGNWAWNEYDYYAKDIPKGVWYPLSAAILDSSIADPTNDGLVNGHIFGDFGIQWNNGKDSTSIWKGVVYIDNVSLVGVKPNTYANFSSSLHSFGEAWANGWVDSVKYNSGTIGDSTGVAEWKLIDGSASTGGVAFGISPSPAYSATTENFLAFWVYIDSTFPDTAHIQAWAQDNNYWNTPSPKGVGDYLGSSIPKDVWYPLYMDLGQADVADSGTFNGSKYPLVKLGCRYIIQKHGKVQYT